MAGGAPAGLGLAEADKLSYLIAVAKPHVENGKAT
jgi:hypothetical protein